MRRNTPRGGPSTEASIWRFDGRDDDEPMAAAQPVITWRGMTSRPMDRRFLLASLLLHAVVAASLVLVFSKSPLQPAAEPPPLVVTLLPPENPPAAAFPAPIRPLPLKPMPAKPLSRPHEAPPELHPIEPAKPAPPAVLQPDISAPDARPVVPQAPSSTPAPAPPTPSSTPLPGAAQGARAIYRPVPIIPDDLREEALNVSAVARFHIDSNGTVAVELVTPTRNPRLNQVLLDSLSRWRFFPAVREN